MFDNLPSPVQHALLALVAALLTWAAANIDSFGLPLGVKAVAAALLTFAIGYLAPPVNNYGIGSAKDE